MRGRSAISGSQSSLREANRALIVDTIKEFGGLTQVELVAATGLSAATISTIVKELLGGGIVDTHNTTRSGRRAQMVTLARRVGLVAGVQFGHRQLRVALGDFGRTVVAEQQMPLPVDHRVDTSLDRAALLVVDLLERVGATTDELLTIGVALPAPVDVSTGRLSIHGIMRGWDGLSIAQVMSKRLGRPVVVDNDANLGALAELELGAGRGFQDLLFVRASYATGAGIVMSGRLHRGIGGTAGEIGHVQVDPLGDICRCGNRGCLDTVVSSTAILDLLRSSHGDLTLRDVITRATDGDLGCRRVISDAANHIGAVVATLVTTLNPQLILLGGDLAEAGDLFVAPLRDAVLRHAAPRTIEPSNIRLGDLGDQAEVMGALTYALQMTEVATDHQTMSHLSDDVSPNPTIPTDHPTPDYNDVAGPTPTPARRRRGDLT